MKIEVHQLFPIPVAVVRLDHDVAPLLAAVAGDLIPGKNQTKNTYLLNSPEFSSLRADLNKYLRVYMQEVLCIAGEPHITQSWANKSHPGEGHHIHQHPNSFVSASFYLAAPEGSSILFHKAVENTSTYTMRPATTGQTSVFTEPVCELPVQTNDLVMFPSYVLHSVAPNPLEVDRWSLALNCVTADLIGEARRLCELLVR